MRTSEEWMVIARNPNYEVSNLGRVRKASTKRVKVPDKNSNGYYMTGLSYGVQGKRHHYNIHRLVAEAFLPNPNNYPCVNHIDGDKLNNSVENLEWCSYSRNNKHAYDHKLKRPYQQRISEDDRREIGRLRKSGMKVKEIAQRYGVVESAIYQLYNRGQIPDENQ